MISTIFRIPIYNIPIKLILVDDIDAYYKSFETQGIEIKNSNDAHRVASVVIDLTEYSVGHAFEFCVLKGMEDDGGNLVHETFHLTCSVMKYIGDKLRDYNEESYAYLQQYLYNKIKLIVKDLRNKEDE
jgi:hypothetical protein